MPNFENVGHYLFYLNSYNMKKTLIRLLLGILLLVSAAGCEKKEKTPEAELVVRNASDLASSGAVTPDGGSFSLLFYSSLPWEASVSPVDAAWLNVSPSSGGAGETYTVLSTIANTSAESRTAYVTISCGDQSYSMTVIQAGREEEEEEDIFEVSPETIEVGHTGGTVSVNIRTNLDYEIEIQDAWITLLTEENVQDGTLEFEVAENYFKENRTGTVVIRAEEYSAEISIIQSAAPEEDFFNLSPTSFEVPAAGGDITVSISTNMDYTVDIRNPEWITLVSGAGVKEGDMIFRIAANPASEERTGGIQFCAGTSCYMVGVLQAGSEEEEEDGPSGGNEDVGNDDKYKL